MNPSQHIAASDADHVDRARAELAEIVSLERDAHLTTDVDLLLAHHADDLTLIHDGQIETMSRDDSRQRFTERFRGATYDVWDFLEPPTIHLAADGTLASVASRVRIERTKDRDDGTSERQGWIYAGLDTYERREGRWVRIVNASTFEEAYT
jgi:ketosteroid isomerase-like protein